MSGAALFMAVLVLSGAGAVAGPQSGAGSRERLEVLVALNTGGSLRGAVLDWNAHGLVLLGGERPYVFSWNELDADSGLAVQRQLMAAERGDLRLSAEQHLRLGEYALRRNRRAAASEELTEAVRRDPSLKARAEALVAAHPPRKRDRDGSFPKTEPRGDAEEGPGGASGAMTFEPALTSGESSGGMVRPSAEARARILQVYLRFGRQVQEAIAKQIALVETEHFLIWTDWAKAEHALLAEWCERMYAELAQQFGVPDGETVFLAKCPVFAFRSANRFRRFARTFDGYDAAQSAGYTRSIESNGHVHLALLRFGDSEADYDQFAWTLAHEGTHAFLHRWHATRLIPHWVNEGLAEWMAQRILGPRCPAGANARMLARVYVQHDMPIRDLLDEAGPIETHQYPLAHSVIEYLSTGGAERLTGLVRELKEGRSVSEALADQWEGLTPERLDAEWRRWVRSWAEPSGVAP